MIVNAQLWGKVLVCYLIAVNVLAFALMGIDKHKARCGAWRISEKALFLPVLLGGGVSKAGQPLLDGVRKYFLSYMFHTGQDIFFALAKLGNDAGIYGSFKLALDAFGR